MSHMTRHLLGGAKEINHDPGPKGDSGEGDAALVMIFLVITLAGAILIYGASLSPRAASHPTPFRPDSPAISVGSRASSRARRSLFTAPTRVRYERRHTLVDRERVLSAALELPKGYILSRVLTFDAPNRVSLLPSSPR